MNHAITLKFAALFLFSAGGAAAELNFDKPPSLAEIIETAKAAPAVPASPQKAVKEWTILVYMNGKNDLYNFALNDLNEMEQAGAPAEANLVVEAGRRAYIPPPPVSGNPFGIPNFPGFPGMMTGKAAAPAASWSGIRRYQIRKDSDPSAVTSPVLEEFNADMGDWNHLAEFGLWAKAKFPARRYMLVVWNHGSGWKSVEILPREKGISYDDETRNYISGVQLGQALAKMGGVDVYASDACLMQMAEVAYELRDSAPLIIGSEETEPAEGWAYNYFLEGLAGAQLTPENLAASAVRGFARYYTEKAQKTTISALYTRNLVTLKTLTDQWAALAMTTDRAALKAARNETKTFKDIESKDFIHFLTLTAEKTPSPELKARSRELAAFAASSVLLYNATTGDAYKNAYGLGIYMPYTIPDTGYNALAWAKAGKWFEFVNWIQK
ncbi:MAG: hypothetical protein A2X35_05500 [Elusimicrobia bacterium GWA2_61_42]|nr:MAG: hypothetical protein A2X35_05500 [Elusimicrobia bacterium GWA2_61_42]OGR74177.1 MAG: hypothetical protein A2X38_11165 [Elusimicrobia bacterium GWC2_61_25]